MQLSHRFFFIPRRSSLASLVDRGEVGSIFAAIAVVQAVSSCLSHLYQMIFVETITWHMGFVYCLNATFFLVVAAISIYLLIFYRKHGIKAEKDLPPPTVSSAFKKSSFLT